VTVLPMTVNWNATESATHTIEPALPTTGDNVYRPSSIDVIVACAAPQVLQISGLVGGVVKMRTSTYVVGPTPQRFKLRFPRSSDYFASAEWNLTLSGAGRVAGIATFTVKSGGVDD